VRSEYYRLLGKYNLQDALEDLEDFSYKKKTLLVKMAIQEGDKKSANQALAYYKEKYIDKGNVSYRNIYSIVRGMSKFFYNKFK